MKLTLGGASKLVMLGSGGHAKVLLSLVIANGLKIHGICDPQLQRLGVVEWRGIRVLGGDEMLEHLDCKHISLINGIGQTVGSDLRRRIYELGVAKGFRFPALVHPTAFVDRSAVLADGVQVMAGAIVQADVYLGCNTIVNTRASVDHDCRVAAHVHIAPGATLCGNVQVATCSFIGAGATVIQGLAVGESSVVGAGGVMIRDLPAWNVLLTQTPRFRPISAK